MTGFEIFAAAASIASGAVGAIGAIQQAKAQAAAAEFNAKVAEQRQKREEEAGRIEAEDARAKASRDRGTLIANIAASGIEASEDAGTPLLLNEAVFRQQELEAERKKFAREVSAERLAQEAALERSKAKNFRSAGIIGAGTSLLSGFSGAFA